MKHVIGYLNDNFVTVCWRQFGSSVSCSKWSEQQQKKQVGKMLSLRNDMIYVDRLARNLSAYLQ